MDKVKKAAMDFKAAIDIVIDQTDALKGRVH